MSEKYYIQDTRCVTGNSVTWWRPNGHGYTCDIAKAGIFSADEAARIVKGRPEVDKAWPADLVESMAELHVSIHDLLRAWNPGGSSINSCQKPARNEGQSVDSK